MQYERIECAFAVLDLFFIILFSSKAKERNVVANAYIFHYKGGLVLGARQFLSGEI